MEKRPQPRAVLFDAYGTLFDVYSVGLLAEQLFPGAGDRLAQLWRDKQIEYTRLVSMSGTYQPFWTLTRSALQFSAEKLGLALAPEAEDRLMNEYRHLSAFPENREVLQARTDLRNVQLELRRDVERTGRDLMVVTDGGVAPLATGTCIFLDDGESVDLRGPCTAFRVTAD